MNESSFSMNGDRANTYWVIVSDPRYLALYNQIFREGQPELSPTQYTASEIPRHARPDRFNAGLNEAWACMATRPEGAGDAHAGELRQGDRGVRAHVARRQLGVRPVRPGKARNRQQSRRRRSGARACSSARRRASIATTARSCRTATTTTSASRRRAITFPRSSTARRDPHAATARRARRPATACPPGAWAGWKRLVEDGAARVVANRFATTSFTRNSSGPTSPTDPGDILHPDRRELQGGVADAQPARRRQHRALHARRLLPDPRGRRLALQRRRVRQRDDPFPDNVEPDPNAPRPPFDVRAQRTPARTGRPGQAARADRRRDGRSRRVPEDADQRADRAAGRRLRRGIVADVGGAAGCATDGGGSQ